MKNSNEVSKISKRIIYAIAEGMRGNIEGDIVAIVNTELLNYADTKLEKAAKIAEKESQKMESTNPISTKIRALKNTER